MASKNHIVRGVEGGFIQANHGKKAPMQWLQVGDGVICYSSKAVLGGKEPYQKFTAIGEVADEHLYTGMMNGGQFQPYRRNINFYDCEEAEIRPLIEDLDFIPNKQKWGYPFRWGFFEISESDFKTIATQMHLHEQ